MKRSIFECNIRCDFKKGEHINGIPAELQVLLDGHKGERDFFESLSKSYRQGYCDWVGSAKQEATRKVQAEKRWLCSGTDRKR